MQVVKLTYMILFQLWAIVNYNVIRNPKSANDTLPHEFINTLGDCCHYFSLDPFGEVFTNDDDKLFLCICYWEWFVYVKAPLSEWPWSNYVG